ncbi:hypothetical protein, partial [Pseudomonas syringae group genomosp. 3]|uniref:hypothetical protein n=1 Tax=Pseudomonas syringae group genomosp. 3 TaxID=251701 RepID=UPI001C8130FB
PQRCGETFLNRHGGTPKTDGMPRLPESRQIYILKRMGFSPSLSEVSCAPASCSLTHRWRMSLIVAFIQSPSGTKADRKIVDGTGIKER